MSFFKVANIGLSVLQNVQQAQTNSKLQSMLNARQFEAEQAAAIISIRDTLFHYTKTFEAAPQVGAKLTAMYFVALSFDDWVTQNSITSAAFDAFSDKEFFGKAQRSASEIQIDARAKLSPEDIRAVEALTQYQQNAAALEAAQAWTRVRAEMKGGKLLWNGRPGIINMIPVFFVGFLLAVMHPGLFFVAYGAGFIALLWRKRQASALGSYVRPYGGVMTSRAKFEEVDAIIEEFKREADAPWLNLGVVPNWPEASRRLLNRTKEEAQRLAIPEEYVLA